MHRNSLSRGVAMLGLCVAPLLLATPAYALDLPSPTFPIVRFTMPNGLRVVVSEDHSAPLVAVSLMYDVGSRDEQKGKSGFAHLFEHVMFQGSRNVPKMGHFKEIEAVGGQVNANTSPDRTLYHQVVPKEALSLVLWLEADRMRSLAVTRDNVDNQRDAVKEERRQNYENRPYALSMLALMGSVFESWPYAHSTIGEMKDLDSAKLEDFQTFWSTYYVPNNAALVLVGDVTDKEARALVDKHFGDIAKKPAPPRPKIDEPDQKFHKALVQQDKLARLPAFHLAYKIPGFPHKDAYALAMLEEILGGGDSSRLERKLTKDEPIAVSVSAGARGFRGPDMFWFFIMMAKPDKADAERAKTIIRDEIATIAKNGVPAGELEKVKTSFASSYVFSTIQAMPRSQMLARFEIYYGDASKVNGELAKYLAVTPADIQRVAKHYFSAEKETEIDVLPKPKVPTATPAPAGKDKTP